MKGVGSRTYGWSIVFSSRAQLERSMKTPSNPCNYMSTYIHHKNCQVCKNNRFGLNSDHLSVYKVDPTHQCTVIMDRLRAGGQILQSQVSSCEHVSGKYSHAFAPYLVYQAKQIRDGHCHISVF